MTHQGLDTCSWDEVDEQIGKLCDRLKGALDYMLTMEQPLEPEDADWFEVVSVAYGKAKALREATIDLYVCGEK